MAAAATNASKAIRTPFIVILRYETELSGLQVEASAAGAGVPARVIGETGGNRLRIAVAGAVEIDIAVDEAERAWSDTIERLFARKVA